jgi:hypothetical protein
MTTDTDITLLAPNQALANISRDELVNLIVDDFMERSAAAAKEANKRANALDTEAAHLLRDIYRSARENLLAAATRHSDALVQVLETMGYKRVNVTYEPLPLPEQVFAVNGLFDPNGHRSGRSAERAEMTLVEAINTMTLGVRLDKPIYVDIELRAMEVGSYLDTSIRFRAPAPEVDLTLYNAKKAEAAKHQRYFSEITEAQNPEKLRRKALATLTREALSQGGVTLQGGLPTMPLALPLAP